MMLREHVHNKYLIILNPSHSFFFMYYIYIFLIFIVIQLQSYAFSPHPSTPPQPNPPPSPVFIAAQFTILSTLCLFKELTQTHTLEWTNKGKEN